MKLGKLATMLILASLVVGCGGSSSTPVGVTISPLAATVVLAGTQQFNAAVSGISNNTVTWQVCSPAPSSDATGSSGTNITMPTGCTIGNSKLGSVNSTGLYTAPSALPNPPTVSVVATSQAETTVFAVVNVTLDSGVRVSVTPTRGSVGTGEQLQLSATVAGTPNSAVNWSVNQVANGNSTVGTVSAAACTATQPLSPPNPNTIPNAPGTTVACYTAPVTSQAFSADITATSAADTRQTGSASIAVQAAVDPVLTSLDPSTAVEGSAVQDVFLIGSNFFSTSSILVNGSPVPTTFIDSHDLRATIPATFFQGSSPTSLAISVLRQNGTPILPLPLGVSPTRPAAIASTPASFPATSTTAGTLTVTGGYFSPSTQVSSEGNSLASSLTSTRQLNISLASPGFPFATPGLFPILIQNTDVPSGAPAFTSVNVAVAPSLGLIATGPNAPLAVGSAPSAVAIDSGLGVAVVVNHGDSPGTVSLINMDAAPPQVTQTLTVGNAPTAVAVDSMLHLAAVVNSTDNTLSLVNLQTDTVSAPYALPSNPTGISPAPSTPDPLPYSVGIDSLTHRAVIAYSSSNIATVVDLSTNPPSLVCIAGGSNPSMANNCAVTPLTNTRPVSTGPAPSIAVEPKLNWAVVTPGGSGSISIVDLGTPQTATQAQRRPNVVATLGLSTSNQGVAINTETDEALLTDPNQLTLSLFSVLDQSVQSTNLDKGEVAAAVNPLTDVGIVVNDLTNMATVIDMRSLQTITTVPVGTAPQAVAIDPGSDQAVIVNQGSNNVSVLPLGAVWSPEITEINPANTFTAPSSGSLAMTVNGYGFASGATVRLDGVGLPTTFVSPRQLSATIPGSMLTSPRRFSVDVANSSGTSAISNEESFAVLGAVPIGLNPIAVAIDPDVDEAFVTSQGALNPTTGACTSSGTLSVVNLSTATVNQTYSVGNCPQGVAVMPRLSRAVVADNGTNDATVIDYSNQVVVSTVSVGQAPMGVAINQDDGTAMIANSGSNTVSLFNVGTVSSTTVASNIPVDQFPTAVSIDPLDEVAAVATGTQDTLDMIDLKSHFLSARLNNFQDPTDIAYDPTSDSFLVANSLQNDLEVVNPVTLLATPVRVGMNPTAVAYNFQSSTAVTVNTATSTLSVLDFLATTNASTLNLLGDQVTLVLPMGGSVNFSVAIDPLTNMAAVVDQANGRLLLVPLPR